MSTSFNIDCSWSCAWLASRQTTGYTVVSCFTASHEKNVFRGTGRFSCSSLKANHGFPRSIMIWVWIWSAWLGTYGLLSNFSLWLSSNFWTQFFHPVMFKVNLWRWTRRRIYLLVYDFSNFQTNNFRDTISCECFVKKDSVRSCLIELQSFLQSKVDVDPIHRILIFFHALCMYCAWHGRPSRSCQDPDGICPWDPQAERILSVCCPNFDLPVSIPNWWWNVNLWHIQRDKCTGRNCSELSHCLVMKDQ